MTSSSAAHTLTSIAREERADYVEVATGLLQYDATVGWTEHDVTAIRVT